MSNQKFKVEQYQNMGGINSKFSPHLTSPLEFLDIKNFDFQTPGCLTQRWGSTQYMSQTLVGKITALSEYQRLSGLSTVIVGTTGGLYYGATTGVFQGMSLGPLGVTQQVNNVIDAVIGEGIFKPFIWQTIGMSTTPFLSTINGTRQGVYYQGATSQYIGHIGSTYGPMSYTVSPIVYGGNYSSISYLVDRAFIADGNKFLKFDGANFNNVGLPLPYAASLIGAAVAIGNSAVGFGGTGIAVFYASYVNNRGFESNIMPVASVIGPASFTGMNAAYASTFSVQMVQMTLTLNTPLSYGISTINIYAYGLDVSNLPVISTVDTEYHGYFPDTTTWGKPFVKIQSFPASGSTLTTIPLGNTAGPNNSNFRSIVTNNGPLANPYTNQYLTLGLTLGSLNQYKSIVYANNSASYVIGTTAPASYSFIDSYANTYQMPFLPQYLSVFDNRLFCAGFSSAPSTVWFSDVKEPEGFLPANSFEVRTNDADYITAMQAYQTRLYIFKKNSFHVLTGDNPDNFFMQEISPIYGCLNNRSVVIFENLMYFLDRKGVVEYTGSNISFASVKIQPIFDRMNYSAAVTTACAAHDKLRNQVLFAIPVDGSTTNNLTVVYDYVAQAWTTHDGYNASIFAEIQGYNTTRRLFCGDYSGRVNWFSASFLSDNGSGITLSYKTRFLHDMGDSVQKQFRRLYLNADSLGTTLSNKINMYQDYGTSIVLGTTLNLGAFQDRIDYGISAKSLAYELITVNSTNSPLKIHGFVIESRLQRNV